MTKTIIFFLNQVQYRALRLLYFLEDPPRFLKHFDRNFDGYNSVMTMSHFCNALTLRSRSDVAPSNCPRSSHASSSALLQMQKIF